MPIPDFNTSGLLPPFVGDPAQACGRSPHNATLSEVIARLGTSEQRRNILEGLLRFRKQLREFGISGVQWLDGSFVEKRDVEPNDIDVITFYNRPDALTDKMFFDLLNKQSLFGSRAKPLFRCDAYYIDVTPPVLDCQYLIEEICYWFGLFSHQRETFRWRGIIAVSLESDDSDDNNAGEMLNTMREVSK